MQSAGDHRKKSGLSNGAQGIVDFAAAAEDPNGIFADVLNIWQFDLDLDVCPGSSPSPSLNLSDLIDCGLPDESSVPHVCL
jgi:hypothetical protein